eukprot:TRINITY_DN2905_c0_g1_i1.p1 TRINITY_DN2905_c0_g1~~TRINITY_DN2905_c0_g1_i1.p1  ORF type:complete len:800 (+),score=187.89 TRINITY_DN2905_c0_g1_i1:233-2632(+)
MYHQGEGEGWRAASPVRVVRNLSPPRTQEYASRAGYTRSGELARLSGKAEALRDQITNLRGESHRRINAGTRIRAVSELTVRGIQAVAVGDCGVVHGPSDDPSLQGGINVHWDCRRDGGTRRINVLVTDIEPIQEYHSPSTAYITRSPYAPSLPGLRVPDVATSPVPISMYTSPVPVTPLPHRHVPSASSTPSQPPPVTYNPTPIHTTFSHGVQTTPSLGASYPPPMHTPPLPSPSPVSLIHSASKDTETSYEPPPPVPSPSKQEEEEKLRQEEQEKLREVQKLRAEEEERLAAMEADRRREEEKVKEAENAIKTEEERLKELTKRIKEEEFRLEALMQRQEEEKMKPPPSPVPPPPPSIPEEEVILDRLSIRMEESVSVYANQTPPVSNFPSHNTPLKDDSSPSISRQPSSKTGRHIHFTNNAETAVVPSTPPAACIDEVESLNLATPPGNPPSLHDKVLGQLQGEWRDNGECTWVVRDKIATVTRPCGSSSSYEIRQVGTELVMDGVAVRETSDKEVRWVDGDAWIRVVPDVMSDVVPMRVTSSTVSSTGTTPAVWMSMSRKNSMRSLGGTHRSILSRKGSLGRMLSRLADERGLEFEDDDDYDDDEEDVDDVVWWQVPKVDVDTVTFVHPHHGDPPGATISPRINTVITLDTVGDPPVLRCSYDGVQQAKITSITLERTEHGVFLLFPDEQGGPVPDRVIALPPDNMNGVVAGIVCLAEKTNVHQHLCYEYEALANQEAIVEKYLKSHGQVPWPFVNNMLPPDYLRDPVSHASVLAALCVLASCIPSGRSGMCRVM